MPRLFLLEPTKFCGPSSRSKFGTFVELFEGRALSVFSDGFQSDLVQRLHNYNFDPARDYIVVTGRMLSVVVFASTVASKWSTFNLLVWDANEQDYTPLEISNEYRRRSAVSDLPTVIQ